MNAATSAPNLSTLSALFHGSGVVELRTVPGKQQATGR